jgi:predicted nuclease of predicted toxin-antitoxin system
MRFLLDENIDLRVVRFLEERDHDVTSIARDYERAVPDREVLALAVREARILITHDRDFGELVFRHGRPHAGVIYLRVQPPDIILLLSRIEELLGLPRERFTEFLVVTRTRLRTRKVLR